MPRVYKPSNRRRYKRYDPNFIGQALEEYNSCPKKSLAFIANKYNISKGVLQRHNTQVMKKPGGQPALSSDAEECIIQHFNICSEWGYPLEIIDVRTIIKGYLDRERIVVKRFKSNMPGQDYARSFMKRNEHKLNPKLKDNLKRSRSGVSPNIIKEYFKDMQSVLQGVPLSNIVNYDETSLSDDPNRKIILIKRNTKYPEEVMSLSRASITLMLAAAADGMVLPQYVVYKAEHLYEEWTENGPDLCRYNRTDSGWFNMTTFEHWITTIVIPYFRNKTGRKVLIGDIDSTHLSVEVIRTCKEHNIFFIFLPANSSHFTQPLDAAFYCRMKKAWAEILFNWNESDGFLQAILPKHIFPSALKILIERMELKNPQVVLAGFQKCGISPINELIVLHSLLHDKGREDIKSIEVSDEKLLLQLKDADDKFNKIMEDRKRQEEIKQAISTINEKFNNETEECNFKEVVDDSNILTETIYDEQIMEYKHNIKDSEEIIGSEEVKHTTGSDFMDITTKRKKNLNSIARPDSAKKIRQKRRATKKEPKESQIKKMKTVEQNNIESSKSNDLEISINFNQNELNDWSVIRQIKENYSCTETVKQEMIENAQDDNDIILIMVGTK